METEATLPGLTNRPDSKDSAASLQNTSLERFSFWWAKLCAAYPRENPSPATTEVYFEQLSIYPEAKLADAINGVLARCKYFPAISEILAEVKGERGCPHAFLRAELRMEKAKLESREKVVIEYERYAEHKVDQLAKKCAELESRTVELYLQDKKNIEESGLPEAQKKLDELQSQIFEYDRTLQTIRAKIRILDQARLIQLTEKEKSWNGRTDA